MLRLLPLLLPLLLVAALVTGCAVGPNYHRPELDLPGAWQNADSTFHADTSVVGAEIRWWHLFGDSVMTDLISIGLQENLDLRIAAARVEELMGRYGVAKSDFFPKQGAAGTASRGQVGEDIRRNSFQVSVATGWEIDLWGKIRRASEAARADLLASEEGRRGVVLTTIALISSSYIDLLALDRQLEIAKETVATRRQALDLFELRRSRGDLSDLVFSQAESEYWLAMSQIPVIEKNVVFLENTINYLLGRNPGPVPRGKTLDALKLPEVPVGIPSVLLERRPDIRAAEEQLRAANARVGVAKSLYFPSISLSAMIGYASDELSKLFRSDTRRWDVSADAFQVLFPWPEINGQVKTSQGVRKEALYAYVKAVRNAFRETEGALVNRSRTGAQADAEGRRVAALSTYARLARMRYEEGVTSYLEVLDAERALFATELDYAQTRSEVYKSVVAIYQALAGSWLDAAAAAAYRTEEGVEPRGR